MSCENRWAFLTLDSNRLRTVHFNHILEQWPQIDWFEISPRTSWRTDGNPVRVLDQIAGALLKWSCMGVECRLAIRTPSDFDYLSKEENLAKRVKAHGWETRFGWTGYMDEAAQVNGPSTLPYNEES